ncbi:kinase-like protein [Agrocybe pediades]|nr:kinase-like protein [Agrocybe pediades]
MSGRPAMVMQWYENGSATDYLAKKNPNADRIQLILDVARGLAYLHTLQPRPIVHADLKGNNVLITDEGRAVLSDFGLSKVVEDLGRPTGFTLSNPDVAAGPLRWQAPEFLESDDEPATLASDVWSFACTAYELLTGQLPYSHRTRDPQIIRDMGNGVKPCGPLDMEQAALGRFDPRIRQLLDSCWSFSVAGRPCMADVQSQLEVVAACTPASQPSTEENL